MITINNTTSKRGREDRFFKNCPLCLTIYPSLVVFQYSRNISSLTAFEVSNGDLYFSFGQNLQTGSNCSIGPHRHVSFGSTLLIFFFLIGTL